MKDKSLKNKFLDKVKNTSVTDITSLAMGTHVYLTKKAGEYAIDKVKEYQQDKKAKEAQLVQSWESYLQNMANVNPNQRSSIVFLNRSEINSVWKVRRPYESSVIYIPIGNNIPGITIKGNPTHGDLYVIDPRNSFVYYSAKEISYILAKDQLLEIKDVFERLGSTYIKITYLDEKSTYNSRDHADNQNVGGHYKGHKINVSREHNSSRTLDKSKYATLSCEKKLTGKKVPINWSDLYWINVNETFRSEVNSLQDGVTKQFHFIEESKSYFSQTYGQKDKIDAEYSFMDSIGVNVGFGWSNEIQESLTKTIVWDIEVSVEKTETGTNENKTALTQNEFEYLAEYKCVLADGEITSRERRSLERTRQRLELSTERVAELEASISQINLTKEEMEYLDEYRNVLADGEITNRERRTLERVRMRLNLSQDQADKLEKMA